MGPVTGGATGSAGVEPTRRLLHDAVQGEGRAVARYVKLASLRGPADRLEGADFAAFHEIAGLKRETTE